MIDVNILFVCTSNQDRSKALVEYFKEVAPQHQYRSAGINKYFCGKKGTHLIDVEDIKWAGLLVFAENVHRDVVMENFIGKIMPSGRPASQFEQLVTHQGRMKFPFDDREKVFYVLDCGTYAQGCVGEDYLTKAQQKLAPIL